MTEQPPVRRYPRDDNQRAVLRELYRAPTDGLTRAELELMVEPGYEEVVGDALHELIVRGWAAGLVRYYLVDALAVGAELGLEAGEG